MENVILEQELCNLKLDDVSGILRLARKLNKSGVREYDFKVAVLGSCSIQYFVQALKVLMYQNGIHANIYEGQYDGIKLDVWNNDSEFYNFHPDIAVMLTDYRDIKEFPGLFEDEEQVRDCVEHIASENKQIWEAVHQRLPDCQIIMSNYVIPPERMLGNLECNYLFSEQSIYRQVNEWLVKIHPPYVLLADMEYLASMYGKLDWFDTSAYMLNKIPFALKYVGYAADLFAKLIAACRGVIRKCIVLDLDNTLWGGIVSEEGTNGIKVSPGDAVGESFLFFQRYLKRLKKRGVILAVCSKNDEQTAKEVFTANPNMILGLKDFAAFYANWDDKALNIRRIAQELNIGLDSIVFFDDSPAERELVKLHLPEVTVIDVPPEPANYARTLELAGCFHWASLTMEDVTRAETYHANRQRKNLFTKAGNYDEYLKQLQMHGRVELVNHDTIHRFSQLINKSNQFNLRTMRYTDAEILGMKQREDYRLLTACLADKFSNYGIVSCIILKKREEQCFIDTWVMSCRVLKRGLEYLVFTHILECARAWGCTELSGEYIQTEKNSIVKTLFPDLGFSQDAPSNENICRYRYNLQREFNIKFYIAEDEDGRKIAEYF